MNMYSKLYWSRGGFIMLVMILFSVSSFCQNIKRYSGERNICYEIRNIHYKTTVELDYDENIVQLTLIKNRGIIPDRIDTLIYFGRYKMLDSVHIKLTLKKAPKNLHNIIYEFREDSLIMPKLKHLQLFSLKRET